MKKKNSKMIWFVLALLIIFGIMIYFYLKPSNNNSNNSSSNIREVTVGTGTIEKTITGSRRSIFYFNRKFRIKYL